MRRAHEQQRIDEDRNRAGFKQLPPKDGQPGKVISGYRWTHVDLDDDQLAAVEQARAARKLPPLADALS